MKELISELAPDEWRRGHGFSDDIRAAHRIVSTSRHRSAAAGALNAWVERQQPCLFARLAARSRVLDHVVLGEALLLGEEEALLAHLRRARLEWQRRAYAGRSVGLVLIAACPAIAAARPDRRLMELALRLAGAFLERPVAADEVCLEDVFLADRARPGSAWRWQAPLNLFAAQADGRWWHSRRIPGGIGFSINSIGHMASAGLLGPTADRQRAMLDLSMRTILTAAVPGGATRLRPAERPCPDLPPDLAGWDSRSFLASYNPDHAVPAVFFAPAAEPPAGSSPTELAFTRDPDGTPAYADSHGGAWSADRNRSGAAGERIAIEDSPLLQRIVSDPLSRGRT